MDEQSEETREKVEDHTRVPVEPLPIVQFEGNLVTIMEGSLPMVNMQMEEGYPLGTHLTFEVEVRVANVRYEEGKGTKRRGEFLRKHVFATESVRLLEAFLPGELDTIPLGNLSSSEDLLEDEEDEAPQIPVEAAPEAPGEPEEAEEPTDSERMSAEITRVAEQRAAELPPTFQLPDSIVRPDGGTTYEWGQRNEGLNPNQALDTQVWHQVFDEHPF